MGLVSFDEEDRELIAAEDAAIIAAMQDKPPTVDGGTVTAPVGSPLASLIETLNAERPQDTEPEGG